MDQQYGPGGWRPLKRFAVREQPKGKWRATDNGRSSGHNEAVELSERIHTTSLDMGVAIAQRLLHLQAQVGGPRDIRRSTKDMSKCLQADFKGR